MSRTLASRKLGDEWEQPVSTILRKWVAGDSGTGKAGDWRWVLDYKRQDYGQDKIVASMRKHGFDERAPVIIGRNSMPDGSKLYTVYDGHHRLTAAVDLHLPKVPVLLAMDDDNYVDWTDPDTLSSRGRR